MDARVLREILQTQPHGRLCFRYWKGAYAPKLLGLLIGQGIRLADLRASRFAPFAAQPATAPALAASGDGRLTPEALAFCDDGFGLNYRLGLDRWVGMGKGYRHLQMSRAGFNLVLQLNFSGDHDERYHAELRPRGANPFTYWGHPVSREGMNTLAWARIDVDFETGEALIEEIQSDWVRFAHAFYDRAKVNGQAELDGRTIPIARVGRYVDRVLRPHAKVWDEAMLTAALGFIRTELGLTRVYMHDPETGAKLKSIVGALPPRSLYSTLPKRFCFEKVDEIPTFLWSREKKRMRALERLDGPLTMWRTDLAPLPAAA